jgi:ketosteroid isomerase-like protein
MKIQLLLTTALALFVAPILFGCSQETHLEEGNDGALSTNVNSEIESDLKEDGVLDSTDTNLASENGREENNSISMMETAIFSTLDDANTNWLQRFNDYQGEVGEFYIPGAILFPGKEEPIKGNEEISAYYMNNYQNVSDITAINVEARFLINGFLVYEIGCFSTINQDEYQYLVTWKKTGDEWLRELDMVAKKIPNEIDPAEIEQFRKNWQEYYNNKDGESLVSEGFADGAWYYTKSMLTSARTMYSTPRGHFSLLEARVVKVMQPDLAYEIGEYTYNGHNGFYIFGWGKDSAGKWKVWLDSNY